MSRRLFLFVMAIICVISYVAYSAPQLVWDGSWEQNYLTEGQTATLTEGSGNYWDQWGATGEIIFPYSDSIPQPTDGYCYLKHISNCLFQRSDWKFSDVVESNTKYLLECDLWLTADDKGFLSLSTLNQAKNQGHDVKRTYFAGLLPLYWNHVTVLWDSATNPEYVGYTFFEALQCGTNGTDGAVRYIDNISLKRADICIEETNSITTVREASAASDTYNIRLYKQPTANVQVTATPGSNRISLGNGPGAAKTISFTTGNWSIPQAVTVTAVNDSIIQNADQYVPITHVVDSTDPCFPSDALRKVNVCIVDNDGADILFIGSVVVSERGPTSGTYNVRLGTLAPTSPVTVNIAYDANQITVSPSQLTFTAGNYATSQIVTVTAVANGTLEPYSQIALIGHTSYSADTSYNGYKRFFPVTVHDQQCGAWPFYPGDMNQDCVVDFKDFAELAAEWLVCTKPDVVGCIQK